MAYSSEVQFIITMVGHSGVQEDMVVEKDPRFLHLGLQEQEVSVCHTEHSLSKGNLETHPLVTHFLQQGHTYTNTTTQPNSVTLYGAIFFQTTFHPLTPKSL